MKQVIRPNLRRYSIFLLCAEYQVTKILLTFHNDFVQNYFSKSSFRLLSQPLKPPGSVFDLVVKNFAYIICNGFCILELVPILPLFSC
jgi:hypothetical protein